MEFAKIDKKILILLLGALVVAVLIGVAAYKQFFQNALDIRNSAGGANTENTTSASENSDEPKANLGGVELEGVEINQPGLTICSDKCGDGVCQKSDPSCTGMNCSCPETKDECPQDCKQ